MHSMLGGEGGSKGRCGPLPDSPLPYSANGACTTHAASLNDWPCGPILIPPSPPPPHSGPSPPFDPPSPPTPTQWDVVVDV